MTEPDTLALHSGYMESAWSPESVLKSMRKTLRGVDYDTIVGTGMSGAFIVPYLARELGKNALLIRKPGDGSHTSLPGEGDIGHRWLFVDDFVSTGTTERRVIDTIDTWLARRNDDTWSPARAFHSEYVGTYSYQKDSFNRQPKKPPQNQSPRKSRAHAIERQALANYTTPPPTERMTNHMLYDSPIFRF